MSQSSAGNRPLEADWESHKNTIQHLYVSEDNPLNQVRDVMRKSHNFEASKSQYERYFKKWGFRKNLKSQEWKAVDHCLGKRKRDGKESELYVDGVLIPKNKVQKETSRNSFTPGWERYVQGNVSRIKQELESHLDFAAPSPKMPAGVIVCTPNPPDMEAFLAENAPWFQYRVALASLGIAQYMLTCEDLSAKLRLVDQKLISPTSFITRSDPSGNDTDSEKILKSLFTIQSVVGTLTPDTQFSTTSPQIRNLIVYMLAAMPETHVGEHEQMVQNLLGPHNQDVTMQSFMTMIYFVLNKLRFLEADATRGVIQWLFRPDNHKALQSLLSIEGPTTDALAEFLFGFAIEAENMVLIKMFLHTGVNPDSSRIRNSYTPLQYASSVGNIELTRLLLDAGADVNFDLPLVVTPLHLAISRRKTELVQLLLDTGARLDIPDHAGNSALHRATAVENTEAVRILISAGANVNGRNLHGHTALYSATSSNAEMVRALLMAGADVNSKNRDGETALHMAAKLGEVETIKFLLTAGADVNVDTKGEFPHPTILEYAAASGSTAAVACILDAGSRCMENATILAASENDMEMVNFLVNAGAEIDHCSRGLSWGTTRLTALTAAVLVQNVDIAMFLLSQGANVNARPSDEGPHLITPLQAAACRDMTDLARVLLAAGANVNAPGQYYTACGYLSLKGKFELSRCEFAGTALQIAIYRQNHELTKILLQAGANVNATASERGGRTALQAAVEHGNKHLVKYLINIGADVNGLPAAHDGITALTAAIERIDSELIIHLLDAGANVNHPLGIRIYDDVRRTPLQLAARLGLIDLVRILLKYGANVNAPPDDRRGLTALQGAAIGGYYEIVRIFLNENADVNAAPAEDQGRTALEGAAEHGRIDVVQLLLNAGATIEGAGGEQYHRALNFAAKEGHYALCKLLRSYHDSRYGTSDSMDNSSC